MQQSLTKLQMENLLHEMLLVENLLFENRRKELQEVTATDYNQIFIDAGYGNNYALKSEMVSLFNSEIARMRPNVIAVISRLMVHMKITKAELVGPIE